MYRRAHANRLPPRDPVSGQVHQPRAPGLHDFAEQRGEGERDRSGLQLLTLMQRGTMENLLERFCGRVTQVFYHLTYFSSPVYHLSAQE